MNEHTSSSVADRHYSDILNGMIDGEFKEGDRLLTELALAERYLATKPQEVVRPKGKRLVNKETDSRLSGNPRSPGYLPSRLPAVTY